tara:strand:+ start:376 stop:1392 length:1017 start_codon:yes stop_codon:yes gene_type:complete
VTPSVELSSLPSETLQEIAENTLRLRAPMGIGNAQQNLPLIERSILKLPAALPTLRESAVVVAAGPSLLRQNIVSRLRELRDRFTLVCCDGALPACLRGGLVPEIVVSVDPDHHRIVRWFGDPKLDERPDDDYYRRQDLDIHMREDERVRNGEVTQLVNRFGPKILAALSTSAAPDVTSRCRDAGMQLYWWNPLYDDWSEPDSFSRQAFELTGGIPCMTGLGHTGGAAWVLAHAVLGCRRVAIVGMDLGYPDGTSVVNTQYYDVVRDLSLDKAESLLLRIENPHSGDVYTTDPVYYWYRETMLDAAQRAECDTVNCSGEGILFGDGLEWGTLEEFAAG